MNYQPAAIYLSFGDDTLPSAAADRAAFRPAVDDVEDSSAEEDLAAALTQRVCSSPSPVDLLRTTPASCAWTMAEDDVTSHPLTSTRTLFTQRLAACCRTCEAERCWNSRIATVPLSSDTACTCSSTKPPRHSPSSPFLAPPPVPRRSRILPADRRHRINDAYSTCTSGDFDVELATASVPSRRFDCFRLCCFRSSKPEEETASHRTCGTADVIGLTTVCRCSAVVDAGNGNRNMRHSEPNFKPTRGGRRHHVTHVMIACIVALPVTCLALLGLFLVISPLYHSTKGTVFRMPSSENAVGYFDNFPYKQQ